MKKRLIACLLLLCLMLSCAACADGEKDTEKTTEAPSEDPAGEKLELNIIDDGCENIYKISVESFCDIDGDEVGDLAGIVSKLDYIKALGYTYIELSPLYSKENFYGISTVLGDKSDLCALIEKAHDMKLEVGVDIRANIANADDIDAVLTYWIDGVGVDGLNFLGASSYNLGEHDKNIEFLSGVCEMARAKRADIYLSGEVSVLDDATINEYYESGFDSFKLFTMAEATGALAGCLKIHNGEALGELFLNLQKTYKGNVTTTYLSSENGSNRVASYMSGMENIKMLAGLQMLMSGSVSTYYGDEIGMVSRAGNMILPMRWTSGTGNSSNYIYAPADKQPDDDNSIYNFYSEMLYLRNCLPSIARGEIKVIELEGNRAVCLIQKTYGAETVTVAINLAVADDPTDISTGLREVKLDKERLGYTEIIGSVCAYGTSYGASYDAESDTLIMPPYSIVVMK